MLQVKRVYDTRQVSKQIKLNIWFSLISTAKGVSLNYQRQDKIQKAIWRLVRQVWNSPTLIVNSLDPMTKDNERFYLILLAIIE